MSEMYFRLRLSNASGEATVDFPWNLLTHETVRNPIMAAVELPTIGGAKNDTTVELFLITGQQPEPEGYEGVVAFGSDLFDFIHRWFQ